MSEYNKNDTTAVSTYKIRDLCFKATLPARQSRHGVGYGIEELTRFERAIAQWLVKNNIRNGHAFMLVRSSGGISREEMALKMNVDKKTVRRGSWRPSPSPRRRGTWLSTRSTQSPRRRWS